MSVHWWSGLKLVLAALGVVILATAVKTFVGWSPKTGAGNALFTVGLALVAAILGSKFLPAGAGPALVTSGLVIGGYEWLKPQAESFGLQVGSGIRGQGGAVSVPSYNPLGHGAGIGSPVPVAAVTPSAPPPTSIVQPYTTIVQPAAKPPSLAHSIIGGIAQIGSSFFGQGGGFGSLVGGSKGVDQFNWTLGSGASGGAYERMLALVS